MKIIFWFFTLVFACNFVYSQDLLEIVSENNQYPIVIPANATEIEKKAAEEFRRLMKLSTSVQLDILTELEQGYKKGIFIGNTKQKLPYNSTGLNQDGFTIQTDEKSLFIKGGTDKGIIYGVYTFFDEYLGYRSYSPDAFTYPAQSEIKISSHINNTQIPINNLRSVFSYEALDPFYRDWHKLNLTISDWGLWVHTFATLLPPEVYFQEHPEYYALIDGERLAHQKEDTHLFTQLCLSNPDVLQIVGDNLEQRMKENPSFKYWSVSQNDTYPDRGYNCKCPECSLIDKKHGSPSGSILYFINRLAKRFPDKIISTLAYRYSRKPPINIKVEPNVNIMFCSIECNRSKPIALDDSSEDFRQDFEGWGKLTNNILMWDYVVQFANYMAPFPNLMVLQPNIQYFSQNGATAHFQQGGITKGCEFSPLRSYLISRLLWNPNIDLKKEMNDFLYGYYEDAAPYISQYIELMHKELENSKLSLTIYGNPIDHINGFMKDDFFSQYERLFNNAIESVKSKPEILNRVKIANTPLTYSLFEITKLRGTEELRVFEKKLNKWHIKDNALNRIDNFIQVSKENGFPHLREGGFSPDEYKATITEALNKIMVNANNENQ